MLERTTLIQRLSLNVRAFLNDYYARHKHPVNAGLHIIGVPMVFVGLCKFFYGRPVSGIALFVAGYLCQYLGHRAQGNEVGEIVLLRKIWFLVKRRYE